MALTEIELQRIAKHVGGLCDRRSPAKFRNELRFEYTVSGQDVLIEEVRPAWDDPSVHTRRGIAKLRFVRTTTQWQLFWLRASGRWESYEPLQAAHTIDALVQEIERDPHGCFFG